MRRDETKRTKRHLSVRLTAVLVAAVFVLGTCFVPMGICAPSGYAADTDSAETEEITVEPEGTDAGAKAQEAVEAEQEDVRTESADVADENPQDADAQDADAQDADQQPAGAEETKGQADELQVVDDNPVDSNPAAADAVSMEDLLVVTDESGEDMDLDDLDESSYDGFIYKLNEDATKKEIKEMEAAEGVEEIIDQEVYAADSIGTIEEAADPGMIEYIEPDYIVKACAAPDDYYYATDGWYLEMDKAPYVWNRGAFGSGAVVAVLDSGVRMNHEDFEDTTFKDPYNVIKDTNTVTDNSGHGTGVTGIIAATYNNKKGLTGIMPKATIMPIKVMDVNAAGATVGKYSWVISGINRAAARGADVISMSFGDTNGSITMENACKEAAAKGVILVASSGNDGMNLVEYPASYDTVISVGAIESDGAHSDFSTYNKYVDVVAPGRALRLPWKAGGYMKGGSTTGTSFSGPQVSAMAAMVKSMDKSVSSAGFRAIIKATSIDKGKKGRDDYFGYGLMDLSRAYRYMAGSFGMYSATLSYTSYVYNGKPRSPAVTVKKANKTLAKSNYSVKYQKNRKAVGTYKVVVEGLGKYTGTKTLKYKIVPPLIKKLKTPERHKKKLTVKWYSLSNSQKAKYKSAITGYQVRVSTSSKFTSPKYVKVKGMSKTSAAVKGLKRKTTYYVQYRAYKTVGKTTYYSKWSAKKKTKTR